MIGDYLLCLAAPAVESFSPVLNQIWSAGSQQWSFHSAAGSAETLTQTAHCRAAVSAATLSLPFSLHTLFFEAV